MTIIETKLSFNTNHSDRKGAPEGIVLHHAATNGSVEDVHGWHKAKGWAGIGYHFYVRKDGTVYRGRPESWRGAHTSGHNDKLGICAEGNFENEYMEQAQQRAIAQLIRYLRVKYGELPIYSHRDLDATACPGKFYPFDVIVSAAAVEQSTPSSQGSNPVLDFQQAALADGLALPRCGADGVWGTETAAAAAVLVCYGSEGERVRLLQRLLGGLDVDGIFGVKTRAAVKAFQAKKSLAVDGIVGINTWKALLGVTA